MVMRVYYILSVIILALIIPIVSAQYNLTLTGNTILKIDNGTITGKAVTQLTTVSATVVVPTPSILILKPKNLTYSKNVSLPLQINSANYSSIWFNINNGPNISLTSNSFYFNTSQGNNILTVFANNTDNTLVQKNVTFFVNSNTFNLNYTLFDLNSITTPLNDYSYEELQNVTNLTLSLSNKGSIVFPNAINLTSDGNSINLYTNINISANRIELNSSALPMLNTSATLTLYDLSFTSPKILKNGILCTSCTLESYSSGTLRFNVTGFSVYTTEEDSSGSSTGSSSGSSTSGSSGGGGGGGGGGAYVPSQIKSLTISDSVIAEHLKRGEAKTKEISFTSAKDQQITLEVDGIKDFVYLPEEKIDLKAGQETKIKINLLSSQDSKVGVYVGKIKVKSSDGEQEILVSITINSIGGLFDIQANIVDTLNSFKPGESLHSEIKLFNFGTDRRVDVELEYGFKDYDGGIFAQKSETLAVETQVNLLRKVDIPSDLKYGDYVFYATVKYGNEQASSTVPFKVSNSSLSKEEWFMISIVILVIIILFVVAYNMLSLRNTLSVDRLVDGKVLARNKYIKDISAEDRLERAFKNKKEYR